MATLKPLDPALKSKFLSLACSLSPENLTCDGELPRAAVARRRKALEAEWKRLETLVGRKVDEMEVW